jgi:hypothetical protein
MIRDPDAHPVLGPLLAEPPEECRAVAELYRHCARGVALEELLGDRRGGAFFVFCEQLGLSVFDEDLDVGYDEVVPVDADAEPLLRLALMAHGEHPEVVEDYTARLCWVDRDGGPQPGP